MPMAHPGPLPELDVFEGLEDLDDAAWALGIVVAALVESGTPLDPLYTNTIPCRRVLTRHDDLHLLLKQGYASRDFSEVGKHDALQRQKDSAELARVLDSYSSELDSFSRQAPPFRLLDWSSDTADADDQAHIASLKIPAVARSPRTPLLLLRNLGSFFKDSALRERLGRIFAQGKHTFLVNASGTGKTRLLIEGLCQHWGIYIVAETDVDGYGAGDLNDILTTNLRCTYDFDLPTTSQGFRVAAVQSCMGGLLLCRLLVLDVFLDLRLRGEADVEDHKILWTLLQVLPKALGSRQNIFGKLLVSANALHDDFIADYLSFLHSKFCERLRDDFHPFIILDEAQVVFNHFHDRDLLRDADGSPYPLLRELVDGLVASYPVDECSLIVAGTDIPSDGFSRSPHSHLHRWISDTGAFDDEARHKAYVTQHRITDSLMYSLLRNGFKSPHRILSAHFYVISGFYPPDDNPFIRAEVPINADIIYPRINFSVLKHPAYSLRSAAIRLVLLRYATTGSHGRPFGLEHINLVTDAFGRFCDENRSQIVFDEPLLVLAAAAQWFCPVRTPQSGPSDPDSPRPTSLLDVVELVSPMDPDTFACVLVIYLAHAFKRAAPKTIFSFPRGAPEWAKRPSELVSVYRGKSYRLADKVSTSRLAASPSTSNELVSWLSHNERHGSPFCLPDLPHADLFFVFRTPDGTFVQAVVAALGTTTTLRDSRLMQMISRADDDALFLSLPGSMRERAISGLHSLPVPPPTVVRRKGKRPPRLTAAPVMRVMASFPGQAHIKNATKSKAIVGLNTGQFYKISVQISMTDAFEQLYQSVTFSAQSSGDNQAPIKIVPQPSRFSSRAQTSISSRVFVPSFLSSLPPSFPMAGTSAHLSFQTKTTPELNARIHGTLKPSLSVFEVGPHLSVSESISRVFYFIALLIGRDKFELYPSWDLKRSALQTNAALRAKEDAIFLDKILGETRKSESSEADFQFLLDEVMTFVIPISPQQAVTVLQAAEEEVKKILREFLARDDPLPLWEPNHILPHTKFLRKLKIPRTPGGENVPDMLLHDLGKGKDSSLDRAIRKIFPEAPPPVVSLVNAPGAGKTKTVIEGLYGHWGFYLTCAVDSERRGSRDLSIAFNKHIKLDPAFVENLEEAAKKDENVTLSSLHRVNCKIARSRISEVLLARICILTWFLDVLKELNPTGPLDSAKNRRLWTILQLHPPRGPNGGDMFQSTVGRILGLDTQYSLALTRDKLETLRSSLGLGLYDRLFCVVDESQTAVATLEHAFMSHEASAGIKPTPRPVFRELCAVLLAPEHELAVIFTGTALARVLLDAIIASKFLKLENDYRPITHFGAFSKPEDHIDYVKKYIPTDLLSTTSFKALLGRIVYWLRGRYRFTSAFIRELLISGFQFPHLRLNAFIKVVTKSPLLKTLGRFTSDGFDATDASIHLESELEANRGDPLVITIGEQRLFDFEKIKDNVRFVELVRTYVPEMCMRSKITSTAMPLKYQDGNGRVLEDFGQLVQYGVARYDENDMGVEGDVRLLMDEPLAIRALLEWLQSCDAPLAAILRKAAVGGLQNHAGNNGVEEYIAFYCAVAFKSGAKLKEIFHFHKGLKIPEWAETSADLVSVYCTNQDSRPNDPVKARSWTAEYDVSPVTDQSGPSNSLGYCASTISDTRRWMQHLERASICFPDKFMGPDLVMVLRLHNAQRSLIWLAIQSKFSAAEELEPSKLKEALPTVTPDGYYERRKKNAVSDEEPQPLAAHQVQILKDMDSLPNRLEIPGFDQRRNKAFMRRMVDHYSGPDFSQPFDVTADELAVLDGCGKHSVLRVIVGWPSLTNLHNRYSTLLQHRYFDDDCHPIVEFNRDRWNTVMEDYLLPEFDNRRHNRSRGTKQDRPDAGHEADEPGPSMKRRKTAHDLDADEFELDAAFEPNANVETQFASQFLHPFRIGEDAGETAAWDELEHGGNPTGSVADGPPLTATDLDATTLGGQSVYDDGGHPRITERRRDGTVRLGGGEVHLRVLGHEIDPHKFWDTHRLGGMSGDLPPLKDSIPQLKLMKKRERRIWPEREDWEIETEFTQEEKGLPLQDRKKIIFERLKRAAERYEATVISFVRTGFGTAGQPSSDDTCEEIFRNNPTHHVPSDCPLRLLPPLPSLTTSAIDDLIRKLKAAVGEYLQLDIDRWDNPKLYLLRGRLEPDTKGRLVQKPMHFRHYLSVTNPDHRKTLTRLLLSSHSLAIERLRWTDARRPRIDPSERKCRLCRNAPETPEHVLLICDGDVSLIQLRNTLMTKFKLDVPAMPPLESMPEIEFLRRMLFHRETIGLVAKFAYEVMAIFESKPMHQPASPLHWLIQAP
ncbi:unnamed protein product [Mycena citricolor]|uniref:Uncharacterized protein n=1 Tax=Mycena citricolor TaxID=2018698 RepID=A0AAD2H112_9AGAR|nr:unnamed protein product [Mycena citricolor]